MASISNKNSVILSYDLSGLTNSRLLKNKNANPKKYSYFIFPIVLVTIMIGFGMLTSVFEPDQAEALETLFWLFGFAALFLYLVYYYAWDIGFKKYIYNRGVNRFMTDNRVTVSNYNTGYDTIPRSIKHPHIVDKKFKSVKLKLETGNVFITDLILTAGGGKSAQDYKYAYAALEFSKTYPHLFLDSTANGLYDNHLSDQQVKLEGNFNKFFRLYMSKGSSAGSLAVLSPDIMQMLLDVGRPFDIELQDNKLFLINSGPAFTQENMKNFLNAANAIYKEFAHLEKSWQPIYNLHGKPYKLKEKSIRRREIFALLASISFLTALHFITAAIRQ